MFQVDGSFDFLFVSDNCHFMVSAWLSMFLRLLGPLPWFLCRKQWLDVVQWCKTNFKHTVTQLKGNESEHNYENIISRCGWL
jgi:hypothetical protein